MRVLPEIWWQAGLAQPRGRLPHGPVVSGQPLPMSTAEASRGSPRESHIHVVVAAVKRAFDVVVSTAVLLLSAPLMVLVALAIRLDSPGPVFFRQLRVGESSPKVTVLFQIIKFRTMRADAETGTGAVLASRGDPRVTRIGRFLRRTRLDELPQLINVLRGEMSLIGPRPERPSIFCWLDFTIPYYGERMYGVKPGITGFAQVVQGYDETVDDVRSKLNFDHAYALALSRPRAWLALELMIVARTVLVMMRRAGQ
jgi:lipopolysaccharide/colanic/teichoic acid biosynthesis glycosyltransferase